MLIAVKAHSKPDLVLGDDGGVAVIMNLGRDTLFNISAFLDEGISVYIIRGTLSGREEDN